MAIDHSVVLAAAAPWIGCAVAKLMRSGYFSVQDRQDLRQELLLAVFQRLALFDPEVCPLPAFLITVVRSRARNLFRQRMTRAGKVGMLPLADLEWMDSHGDRRKPDLEILDLVLDVEAILHTLPPRLRQIARLLMEKTPAEVARNLRMTRHTLRKAIGQLDQHFRILLGTSCPNGADRLRAVRVVRQKEANLSSLGDPLTKHYSVGRQGHTRRTDREHDHDGQDPAGGGPRDGRSADASAYSGLSVTSIWHMLADSLLTPHKASDIDVVLVNRQQLDAFIQPVK
jgi:RNA polymerase sigma factor (sigma-70 family)